MNLATLRDMAELWGYKCDISGDIMKMEASDQDYCLIRWAKGGFMIDVYDTPTNMLRDLADYCKGTKTHAEFRMKSPSTKQRKYGK